MYTTAPQGWSNPGTSAPPTMTASGKPKPSSLACHECRRKHLKCDGMAPCRRCFSHKLDCTYIASRRGLQRRKQRETVTSVQSPTTTSVSPGDSASSTTGTEIRPYAYGSALPDPPLHRPSLSHQGSVLPTVTSDASATRESNNEERERLISLFYVHFYSAHPFLVPRAFYATQQYPHYLDLVVCFVGHHFSDANTEYESLRVAVYQAMSELDEMTVYRVQALILFAIVSYARQQKADAESSISRAAKIALALGMNGPSFARAHAVGISVVEESMRRTWWELYTVDVCLAAINRRSTFGVNAATTLPLLPCSQSLYEAGRCEPDPPSIRTFENRVFAGDSDQEYPSYCYRIDAIRIVGRVLTRACTPDVHPDEVQALDNALISWDYNLPLSQKDIVSQTGEVNQMLVQARCFISCANIFLHFPRSDLLSTVPVVNDISCVQDYTQLNPTSRQHALKAITASKAVSNMASIPWPLDRISPFFICGLVLSCIIQLAAAAMHLKQFGMDCMQQHRERVILMLGALSRLEKTWPLVPTALRRLRGVASTVFAYCDEFQVAASVSSGSEFNDSGIGSVEELENIDWLNMFSFDDLQNNMFGDFLL